MLVAQVSDGRLQLGGLLDKFKVDVDEYKEIIENFKQLELNSRKFTDRATGKANWNAIAKSIEGCDETALSYFKTLDDGNGTINNQAAYKHRNRNRYSIICFYLCVCIILYITQRNSTFRYN